VSQFRKKPVAIHAVKWDGNLSSLAPLWPHTTAREVQQEFLDAALIIPTLEGDMRAEVGDWIICGVKGELYPCKPAIFEATYEPVGADE
jgi:hypothetical protein